MKKLILLLLFAVTSVSAQTFDFDCGITLTTTEIDALLLEGGMVAVLDAVGTERSPNSSKSTSSITRKGNAVSSSGGAPTLNPGLGFDGNSGWIYTFQVLDNAYDVPPVGVRTSRTNPEYIIYLEDINDCGETLTLGREEVSILIVRPDYVFDGDPNGRLIQVGEIVVHEKDRDGNITTNVYEGVVDDELQFYIDNIFEVGKDYFGDVNVPINDNFIVSGVEFCTDIDLDTTVLDAIVAEGFTYEPANFYYVDGDIDFPTNKNRFHNTGRLDHTYTVTSPLHDNSVILTLYQNPDSEVESQLTHRGFVDSEGYQRDDTTYHIPSLAINYLTNEIFPCDGTLNIHGGGSYLDDYVLSVRFYDADGDIIPREAGLNTFRDGHKIPRNATQYQERYAEEDSELIDLPSSCDDLDLNAPILDCGGEKSIELPQGAFIRVYNSSGAVITSEARNSYVIPSNAYYFLYAPDGGTGLINEQIFIDFTTCDDIIIN